MKKFPSGFHFGIGDADLQVIGERRTIAEENSQPTMWTACAQSSGRVYQNDTPLEGVDRYSRWREDVELLKQLGVKHYRTSVSMARLLTARGEVNIKALQWYQEYFRELRRNDISIYVTLYHWELPDALHRTGGWTSRETVSALELHAVTVAQELDEFITEYFVINEHICVAFLGYFEGLHAPFEKNLSRALQSAHHLLLAQGRCLRRIKELRPKAQVGTVYNLCPVYAETPEPDNLTARYRFNGMFMDWLLEPVYTGSYPEEMQKVLSEHLPQVQDGDGEEMKVGAELSTLGINYYFGQTVAFDPGSPVSACAAQSQFQVKTGLGWPVYVPPAYPRGLYDLLLRTYARYELLGLKRIVITENGTAWPVIRAADGSIDDQFRIDYIREHLTQIWDACRSGVPVAGYFVWTLLDNYEWQEGYRPESAFGMVAVDRETMERTPKRSYDWYRQFLKDRSLD